MTEFEPKIKRFTSSMTDPNLFKAMVQRIACTLEL